MKTFRTTDQDTSTAENRNVETRKRCLESVCGHSHKTESTPL